MQRVTVIGVCGPSGSGKSTLCRLLASQLETSSTVVDVISMDRYFRPTTQLPVHPKWGVNFETPEGIDVDKFMRDTVARLRQLATVSSSSAETKTTEAFLILEGFLLLYFPCVVDLCSVRVFLDAEQAVCCERRCRRSWVPAEENEAFREFYDGLVWSYYMRYHALQLRNMQRTLDPDGQQTSQVRTLILNASKQSPEELCAKVLATTAAT